jgi:hypothetical protein
MKSISVLLSACLVVCAAVCFYALPVQADLITIMAGASGDADNDLWTVSWPDSLNKVLKVEDKTPGNDGKNPKNVTKKLLETLTWDNGLKSVTLTFKEVDKAKADFGGKHQPPDEGLHFVIGGKITNNSDAVWKTFSETLVPTPDAKGIPDNGSDAHPLWPHFHDSGFNVKTGSAPLKLTKKSISPVPSVEFAGGMVQTGMDFVITGNLRIHEIEVKGYQREFQLVEVPNPEPSSCLVFTAGALALVGFAWQVRRRKKLANRDIPEPTVAESDEDRLG